MAQTASLGEMHRGNAFGISVIILLRRYKWRDVIRRHQPKLMTARGNEPTRMVRATASFHRDNAGWQLFNNFDQCLSPRRSTDNHGAPIIHPNNAAVILSDVDTQNGKIHGSVLSLQEKDIILDALGRADHPEINIKSPNLAARLL